MKYTIKAVAVAALCSFAIGCSSGDKVPDQDPGEQGMDDYGDEYALGGEDDPSAEDEEATEDAEPVAVADPARALLEEAAEGEHRSEENRARNQFRNPVETLLFFGFEPSQTVVELWPGGGWYTEVLAPALAEDGQLVAGLYVIDEEDPEDYRTKITASYLELVDVHADLFGTIETGTFDPPNVAELGEPESADLVVTFRNFHNAHSSGTLEPTLEAVHEVLKSGGTFGVVQHRAPEGSDPDETAPKGYLPEAYLIELIEEAGFTFEESSEVNANPKDTADHEDGVWALPPSLRGGEEDAERFLEIGESDRMTLRFVKD